MTHQEKIEARRRFGVPALAIALLTLSAWFAAQVGPAEDLSFWEAWLGTCTIVTLVTGTVFAIVTAVTWFELD
jgi:hypothetical protein